MTWTLILLNCYSLHCLPFKLVVSSHKFNLLCDYWNWIGTTLVYFSSWDYFGHHETTWVMRERERDTDQLTSLYVTRREQILLAFGRVLQEVLTLKLLDRCFSENIFQSTVLLPWHFSFSQKIYEKHITHLYFCPYVLFNSVKNTFISNWYSWTILK